MKYFYMKRKIYNSSDQSRYMHNDTKKLHHSLSHTLPRKQIGACAIVELIFEVFIGYYLNIKRKSN